MSKSLSFIFVVFWISSLLSVAIWAIYRLPKPVEDVQSNLGIEFSEERALKDLRCMKIIPI